MKHTPMYWLAATLLSAALGPRGDALTVQAILSTLTPQDFFTLANQPVPESEYPLLAILPEELRASYEAKSGTMKVITTPAGETGMDSPYTPVGGMEIDAFSRPIAKWTAETVMTEQQQRELQQMVLNIRGGVIAGNGLTYIRNFVVNWLNKVIRQSFTDRYELMRGEALTTGQLVLRGGTVDYGVPSANKFASRTGNDAYGGSASKFWTDMRRADAIVGTTRSRIMSMNTLHQILDSQADRVAVTSETTSAGGNIKIVTLRRLIGSAQTLSNDVREGYTLVGYRRTVKIKVGKTYADQQVLPDGKIAVVGGNDVMVTMQDGTVLTRPGLGRTHIGPTVEGDGRPGIWLNAYTPQGRPMHAVAQGASNGLVVYDAPERLVILTTAML
ncbi:major capsid protein [Deinococcus sp. HMF7604]|uniref:major capsid protein n=1 Tax=Deinococcus betulae TaxID=2873312 RepID=UPI001CCBC8B7|nr:major capsid protein [Deinococcus betulae]MBZ9752732.1 major capsid protein [Deinococcus betulae]